MDEGKVVLDTTQTSDFYHSLVHGLSDLECPIDGCGVRRPNRRMLGLHFRRAHGIISSKTEAYGSNGHKPRKPYTRKAPTKTPKPQPQPATEAVTAAVKYCPNCGFHIEELNLAIHALRKG